MLRGGNLAQVQGRTACRNLGLPLSRRRQRSRHVCPLQHLSELLRADDPTLEEHVDLHADTADVPVGEQVVHRTLHHGDRGTCKVLDEAHEGRWV